MIWMFFFAFVEFGSLHRSTHHHRRLRRFHIQVRFRHHLLRRHSDGHLHRHLRRSVIDTVSCCGTNPSLIPPAVWIIFVCVSIFIIIDIIFTSGFF